MAALMQEPSRQRAAQTLELLELVVVLLGPMGPRVELAGPLAPVAMVVQLPLALPARQQVRLRFTEPALKEAQDLLPGMVAQAALVLLVGVPLTEEPEVAEELALRAAPVAKSR